MFAIEEAESVNKYKVIKTDAELVLFYDLVLNS